MKSTLGCRRRRTVAHAATTDAAAAVDVARNALRVRVDIHRWRAAGCTIGGRAIEGRRRGRSLTLSTSVPVESRTSTRAAAPVRVTSMPWFTDAERARYQAGAPWCSRPIGRGSAPHAPSPRYTTPAELGRPARIAGVRL